MRPLAKEHAFTAVDAQADPASLIAVLDKVRREPTYAAYKARIGEVLAPKPGQRFLEVGTGDGGDALAFASRFGVGIVGVDLSSKMVEEAHRRGLRDAQVADAASLPFDSSSFDGCWADRTFQHLSDPRAALMEMVRVTRPGGTVAVVDPDYDSQVVDVADQVLARRVLRFRADHLLRNGTLAHQMGGLFVRAGLSEIRVEAFTVLLRDPAALDNAMGLRSWAAEAQERGFLDVTEVGEWERSIDAAIVGGHFLYSFTLFLTAGLKPA